MDGVLSTSLFSLLGISSYLLAHQSLQKIDSEKWVNQVYYSMGNFLPTCRKPGFLYTTYKTNYTITACTILYLLTESPFLCIKSIHYHTAWITQLRIILIKALKLTTTTSQTMATPSRAHQLQQQIDKLHTKLVSF